MSGFFCCFNSEKDLRFVEVLGHCPNGSSDFWRKASTSYRGSLLGDIVSEDFVRETLQKSDDIVVERNNISDKGVSSSSRGLGKVLLKWTKNKPVDAITSEFHVVSSNEIDFDVIFGRKSIIQHDLSGQGLSNPTILKVTGWVYPTK